MLRRARPGDGAVAPREYAPKTAGGHDGVLKRFRAAHADMVHRANDLRRDRDEQTRDPEPIIPEEPQP